MAAERFPKQDSQADKEFLTRLEDFGSAAVNLTEAWDRADHTGSYYAGGYPFDKSFTDVVLDILHWKYVQQGQSLGDDATILLISSEESGEADSIEWGEFCSINKDIGQVELRRVEKQLIMDRVSFIGGGAAALTRLERPQG